MELIRSFFYYVDQYRLIIGIGVLALSLLAFIIDTNRNIKFYLMYAAIGIYLIYVYFSSALNQNTSIEIIATVIVMELICRLYFNIVKKVSKKKPIN